MTGVPPAALQRGGLHCRLCQDRPLSLTFSLGDVSSEVEKELGKWPSWVLEVTEEAGVVMEAH